MGTGLKSKDGPWFLGTIGRSVYAIWAFNNPINFFNNSIDTQIISIAHKTKLTPMSKKAKSSSGRDQIANDTPLSGILIIFNDFTAAIIAVMATSRVEGIPDNA